MTRLRPSIVGRLTAISMRISNFRLSTRARRMIHRSVTQRRLQANTINILVSILLSGTDSGFTVVEVNEGVAILSALLTEVTTNGNVDNGTMLGEQIVQKLFVDHFLGIMGHKVDMNTVILTWLIDCVRLRWATESENSEKRGRLQSQLWRRQSGSIELTEVDDP